MKRLLYVDDTAVLRRALTRLLSSEDLEVVLAEDGEEAIELLKTQKFDVVLSDVMMPGMNGVDLYEWIRTEKPDLVKKFIFISAGFDMEIGDRIRQTPVKLLPKPCDTSELKRAVNEAAYA